MIAPSPKRRRLKRFPTDPGVRNTETEPSVEGMKRMRTGRAGLLCAIFVWIFGLAGPAHADRVRVRVTRANVRTEPAGNARIVTTTHKGDLLPILDSAKNWWKVKLPGGKDGWIYKKAVRYEKDTYRTRIRALAESVLGPGLKWASLNEVYLAEEEAVRLDVMVTPQWVHRPEQERKAEMVRMAKGLAKLCSEDELLKRYTTKPVYVVFLDRYNTPVGEADEQNARIIK